MMAVIPNRGACPHLGLADDEQTALAYPSEWNLCYRCQPPRPPDQEHQSNFCLEQAHATCPVFLAPAGGQLPNVLRFRRVRRRRSGRRLIVIFGLLALLMLLLAGAAWYAEQIKLQTDYLGTSAVQTAVILHMLSTPIETNTSVASTETVAPAATSTEVAPSPSPESARGLDQVIGDEFRFILHRIAPGENIALLARQFNTTDQAIVAVNFVLPVPIWVDWVVIIPIDRTDVSGLPAFEAYQAQGDVAAETLATELKVDLESFLFYNSFDPGEMVRLGDWVLVPRTAGEP